MKPEVKFRDEVLNPALKVLFPNSYIIKNNSEHAEIGTPDQFLINTFESPLPWVAFEIKRTPDSYRSDAQVYHVNKLNLLGYACIIHPLNYLEILEELEQILTASRAQ